MNLAIVGTAGRKEDAPKLTAAVYAAMYEKAKLVIRKLKEDHNMTVTGLVSGGAAGADHVAVDLFLDRVVENLLLFLPAQFNRMYGEYIRTESYGFSGMVANHYHDLFSETIQKDSLFQLSQAVGHPHCTVVVGNGFKDRNTRVAAASQALLAMTFGNGMCVKQGGTADTVRKFHKLHPDAPTYHMDLNSLLCYRNAIA